MFYLLLIAPHLIAMAGLCWFAFRTKPWQGDDSYGDFGPGPDDPPPVTPRPESPDGGLPLPDAAQPRRRTHVGEQLADLYPPKPRRDHPPAAPRRAPVDADEVSRAPVD